MVVVVYIYLCLYPFTAQARCHGHTPQLSGLSVSDTELEGFVSC